MGLGGGGAMRAAATAVVKGVTNPGLPGFPAVPTAKQIFTSIARPVASICSSFHTKIDASTPVQKPCVGEPMPRLVFGGEPTLEEAKEATSDLEATLDVAHPSPEMLVHSNSEHLETNAVPNPAFLAFRFLKENSAVQTVVESLATDLNVFDAVMNNEAVVEYLHSQKTSSIPRNGFKDFFQNIKAGVKEEMNGLSGYFRNLLSGYFQNPFGGPEAADGSDKTNFADTAMGASIMGLAVMVIMVVVLK